MLEVAGDHAVEGRHVVVVVWMLHIFDAQCLRRERTSEALREPERSGGAHASTDAGERQESVVPAVRAVHPREPVRQDAAAQVAAEIALHPGRGTPQRMGSTSCASARKVSR